MPQKSLKRNKPHNNLRKTRSFRNQQVVSSSLTVGSIFAFPGQLPTKLISALIPPWRKNKGGARMRHPVSFVSLLMPL